MNKGISSIGLTLVLAGCAVASNVPDAIRTDQSGTTTSSVLQDITPSGWTTRILPRIPLTILLPAEAKLEEEVTNNKGKHLLGISIRSNSDWARPDYFSFGIYPIEMKNIDTYLNSICPTEARIEGLGYKLFDRWNQAGCEFVYYRIWQCSNPSTSIARGIVLGNATLGWFVLVLPPGDWGEDGWKYFDIALHSIRPVSESNSSTGS